jgi:hypothetical protein
LWCKKKLITRAKVSRAPLFIHKSNVVSTNPFLSFCFFFKLGLKNFVRVTKSTSHLLHNITIWFIPIVDNKESPKWWPLIKTSPKLSLFTQCWQCLY